MPLLLSFASLSCFWYGKTRQKCVLAPTAPADWGSLGQPQEYSFSLVGQTVGGIPKTPQLLFALPEVVLCLISGTFLMKENGGGLPWWLAP